ncbi:MAG TPA: hypothetical protein VMX94_02665 [Armatimonadota bacterium]|nr:hypothetical protein [Armatimonadota bacterium]
MATQVLQRKFNPGRIAALPDAAKLDPVSLAAGLTRHLSGDWGDMCDEDKEANDLALKEGRRLMSAYKAHGVKFWIITECDRSATTFLLPEEY